MHSYLTGTRIRNSSARRFFSLQVLHMFKAIGRWYRAKNDAVELEIAMGMASATGVDEGPVIEAAALRRYVHQHQITVMQ